jgi:thioredoxin 1
MQRSTIGLPTPRQSQLEVPQHVKFFKAKTSRGTRHAISPTSFLDEHHPRRRGDDVSEAIKVESGSFQGEVLDSALPVMVDFWAPWCGPCKLLTPTIEELARDYAGKAKVVKVNVDDNQDLATKYGIRGIPTVMVFKGGQPVASLVGMRPKADLAQALDAAM